MRHVIYPGSDVPFALPGDEFEIEGKVFPYIGELNSIADANSYIPVGVYRIKLTGNYFLHHSKSQNPEIVEAYQQHKLQLLESDNEIYKREKVSKEIFRANIKQNDSHLKVVMKKLLDALQIDIHDYKDKFQNDNHMNNMKRLITSDAGLTFDKFVEFINIFDCAFNLEVYLPNGKKLDL
jgi:hypothetical protein